jgi:cell division transport system ATP-binding protein
MQPDNPIIKLEKVSVYRDKILVLSELDLSVDKGEFVYLIGKTGSGKSSVLKTLYAELQIEDGKARIFDYDLGNLKLKRIPFLRRNLGIVFQDFQLLTDRTVNANLEFVMKATGWNKKEKIEKRTKEVLELVGIPTKGFKMPHELSGGEQQRVCIARSLINDPGIILADEPTGNLDPETSSDILQVLHDIHKSGTTVLLATHSHFLINKFPGRIVTLDRGKIIN